MMGKLEDCVEAEVLNRVEVAPWHLVNCLHFNSYHRKRMWTGENPFRVMILIYRRGFKWQPGLKGGVGTYDFESHCARGIVQQTRAGTDPFLSLYSDIQKQVVVSSACQRWMGFDMSPLRKTVMTHSGLSSSCGFQDLHSGLLQGTWIHSFLGVLTISLQTAITINAFDWQNCLLQKGRLKNDN